MSRLHTLTLQDVLWIHFQIARKVVPYDFAKLEEATFYQFAYGDSTGLVAQAGRFAKGFHAMAPFASDNEATGFVALVAYLSLNGWRPKFDAAGASAAYAHLVREGSSEAIEAHFEPDPDSGGHAEVRDLVYKALARYGGALHALAAAPA